MSLFKFPFSFTAGTKAKAEEVNANFEAAEEEVNDTLRPGIFVSGDLKTTARAAAPSGWLMCDGSAISRTTYKELFEAIGTTYGAGDGGTTFNVPDLRGRVAMGVDGTAGRITISPADVVGDAGGTQRLQGHTHDAGSFGTDTQNIDHHHFMDIQPTTRHEGSGFAYDGMSSTPGVHKDTSTGGAPHSHDVSGISGLTGEGGSENLQPYLVVNWLVKI